jgi:hypothetical protein
VPTGQVVPLARPELQQLAAAAAAFLAQPSLAASTRRSYQQALGRLERKLGAAQLLEDLTVEAVTAAVITTWGRCAPATWNRHVATVRSFVAYCRRRRWLTVDLAGDLERRPEPTDRTKRSPWPSWSGCGNATTSPCARRRCGGSCTRPPPAPARPWRSTSRTLTSTTSACESAPKVAILTGSTSRPARPGCSPGCSQGAAAARCSSPTAPPFPPGRPPRLTAARRPAGARLSYRRAEALFLKASGGRTLHQLRHSAFTHLVEQNISLPLLMAKSRHASLRSLQRYARPGAEAVAALTAATDPARRRR